MKQILKIVPILLLALVLAVSPLLMAVPVSAASEQLYSYNGYVAPALPVSLENFPYCFIVSDGSNYIAICSSSPICVDGLLLIASEEGSFSVCSFLDDRWVVYDGGYVSFGFPFFELVDSFYLIWSSTNIPDLDSSSIFFFGSPVFPYFPASGGADGEVVTGDGIFYQAYDLFSTYIYGVEADALTPDQTLSLTIMATVAALFLVSLPFLIVWRVFLR